MRDQLSLNCASANTYVFSLCIALRNGDPIGPKVVRGIGERDPGDPGTSYGKLRTQVACARSPARDFGNAIRDNWNVRRSTDHTVPGNHGM
jgi:hypothetical protein